MSTCYEHLSPGRLHKHKPVDDLWFPPLSKSKKVPGPTSDLSSYWQLTADRSLYSASILDRVRNLIRSARDHPAA